MEKQTDMIVRPINKNKVNVKTVVNIKDDSKWQAYIDKNIRHIKK